MFVMQDLPHIFLIAIFDIDCHFCSGSRMFVGFFVLLSFSRNSHRIQKYLNSYSAPLQVGKWTAEFFQHNVVSMRFVQIVTLLYLVFFNEGIIYKGNFFKWYRAFMNYNLKLSLGNLWCCFPGKFLRQPKESGVTFCHCSFCDGGNSYVITSLITLYYL
jgi:hypothetical protein